MPANNAKVMDDIVRKQMNDKYRISYDESNDKIVVELTTCKRKTLHDSSVSFCILSKRKPKRKIVFSLEDITIWLECLKDEKTKHITLIDVHDTIVKLKVMYQKASKEKVYELLQKDSTKIKKI